jgi:hypothetical protein
MILECVKARTCVAELEKYHYELEAARNALEVAGLRQCNDETPAPNTLTLTYDEVELLAGLLNQFHIPNGTTAMRELAGKIEKLIGGPKQ